MKCRADVVFIGKVQGVNFRPFTKRFAIIHEVNGWVKNLPDGNVEAVFEGDKENIDEVIRKLKEEHPFARGDKVEIMWSDYSVNMNFLISRSNLLQAGSSPAPSG